jgi:MoaA/NifB/PqqE/SkfB family radical SAM enzyme
VPAHKEPERCDVLLAHVLHYPSRHLNLESFIERGVMSEVSYLKKHLTDEARRQQLLDIESRMVEHDFPPQLVVENTSYCNLRCIHCSHTEMLRPQRHMERSLWDKIVEEVGRESPGCEVWPTFYGEALILGDELWARLRHASDAGCRNLVLNSNGTLLARNNNIEKVLDSPLKRFILSLDGLSKEVFESIRVKAKWEKVYPAVAELCRRREERGQKYPVIVAQFSAMKENIAEVEDYRRHWNSLGAEVKVRPMLEWTATGSIRSDSITHDSDFRIACPWGNNTMAIHQDGLVVACAVDYEGRHRVADVRQETVREAWRKLGETLRTPQRQHRWGDIPDICKGCGDWQVAGAEYEAETVEATRPFWYYERDPEREKIAD